MQTAEYVQYQVDVYATNWGDTLIGLGFNSADLTDAEILNLVEGLRNVPWPASLGTVTVSATKNESTVTTSQCGVTTEPAAFN
jgi:hypothetical protein